MRPRRRNLCAALLVTASVMLPQGVRAEGPPSGKPSTLAVIEMRVATTSLPGLGERVAAAARDATSLAVVPPGEARRRIPDVDAAVLKCAGEGECLASIGRRLEVGSLLVAAISELGQVIVLLTLVDVEAGRVVSRHADSPSGPGAASDSDVSAWLRSVLPREAFQKWGMLSVAASVEGASVEVDGFARGLAPISGMRVLAPEVHHVYVSKPGHVPFEGTVEVLPDRSAQVFALLPASAVPKPFFRRPWFLGIAGLAVLGGTGYLLRDSMFPPPETLKAPYQIERK